VLGAKQNEGMADLSPVAVLWVTDWYGGPVEGMASFEGRECWFQAIFDAEADEWTNPRRCRLYELSEDERAWRWAEHRRWEELGGGNSCFHDNAPDPALKPGWRAFYQGHDDRAVRLGREIGQFTAPPLRRPRQGR
jgi:hypothetical protein